MFNNFSIRVKVWPRLIWTSRVTRPSHSI